MSDRLSVSAAFSVLIMAAYVLCATPGTLSTEGSAQGFGPIAKARAAFETPAPWFLPHTR